MEYGGLTREILGCCFEVMNELGPGLLEQVYKNALFIVLNDMGLKIDVEKPYQVMFREQLIGRFRADLVVENMVIVEVKCCEHLLQEHKAQLINYLQISKVPVGLLVNFQRCKLESRRLHRPEANVEFDSDELNISYK